MKLKFKQQHATLINLIRLCQYSESFCMNMKSEKAVVILKIKCVFLKGVERAGDSPNVKWSPPRSKIRNIRIDAVVFINSFMLYTLIIHVVNQSLLAIYFDFWMYRFIIFTKNFKPIWIWHEGKWWSGT